MSETKNKPENEVKTEYPLEITFKKPFVFEKKTYEKVDISDLKNMTGKQFINIENMIKTLGVTSLNPESTLEGAFVYASQTSGLPIEFFEALPAKEAKKVKMAVINYLWHDNTKPEKKLEIVLEKPHKYKEETYEKIDLSRMEEMTGKKLADIERAIRMIGIGSESPETTAVGAFMHASWATDLEVGFFYSLPIKEARKVKVAIINFLWN